MTLKVARTKMRAMGHCNIFQVVVNTLPNPGRYRVKAEITAGTAQGRGPHTGSGVLHRDLSGRDARATLVFDPALHRGRVDRLLRAGGDRQRENAENMSHVLT